MSVFFLGEATTPDEEAAASGEEAAAAEQTSERPPMESWGKDEVPPPTSCNTSWHLTTHSLQVAEWAVSAIPSSLIHHSAIIAALDSEDIDGPALAQLGASAITAQQVSSALLSTPVALQILIPTAHHPAY